MDNVQKHNACMKFSARYLLCAAFLLGLLLDPEDEGDMFPRNISRLSTDNMVVYSRR
jgi:hypothetical protein